MIVIKCDMCLREIPQKSHFKLVGNGGWFEDGSPFKYINGNGQAFCGDCWNAVKEWMGSVIADRVASTPTDVPFAAQVSPENGS